MVQQTIPYTTKDRPDVPNVWLVAVKIKISNKTIFGLHSYISGNVNYLLTMITANSMFL